MENLLEIHTCFTNHAGRLPTKLDKINADILGQGNLDLVREKSGKCQGILLSIICGNPDTPQKYSRSIFHQVEFIKKLSGNTQCVCSCNRMYAYYPPTKLEGYSFGCVSPSIPSVRLHFLSVWNHISVPIGQI